MLDKFLDEEGAREAFQAVAIKEVLAWQITEAMKAQGLSRKRLAERMGTSRSQVSRLLDPKDGNVTLVTLHLDVERMRRARSGPEKRQSRLVFRPRAASLIAVCYIAPCSQKARFCSDCERMRRKSPSQ
ncbi:MAG TPA: helix-turn-helix transcriptional regulator [Xanthobacteraceae bacterium]|nr:helix-turn-helix transcriptional regulator [Xanthobacteraceae bacterium]